LCFLLLTHLLFTLHDFKKNEMVLLLFNNVKITAIQQLVQSILQDGSERAQVGMIIIILDISWRKINLSV